MIKKSIECWIYDEAQERFLLLHVSNQQVRFWQPITGGIEAGEMAPAAAVREISEETGIQIREGQLVKLGKQSVEIEGGLCLDKSLFLVSVARKQVQLSPEHDDFMWVPAAKVEERLLWPNNKASLVLARKQLHI